VEEPEEGEEAGPGAEALIALCVVVETGEADEGLVGRSPGRDDLLADPGPRADANELTGPGKSLRRGARFGRRNHRVVSLLRREVTRDDAP
jgi:hypothetical protein